MFVLEAKRWTCMVQVQGVTPKTPGAAAGFREVLFGCRWLVNRQGRIRSRRESWAKDGTPVMAEGCTATATGC